MIQTKQVEYRDGEILLEGFYAFDDKNDHKKPLVIVSHDWSGRNEFADEKAKKLAELGYVGFAWDLYGFGKIGKTNDEKMALIKPLMADRDSLLQRMLAGLSVAKSLPEVDAHKIGAIGFCFGGLCVLDLARSGEAIAGVVSFHGLLNAPQKKNKCTSKILVLHGHDDPMVKPEEVLAFEKEMTEAKVDWQLQIYSQTMHAFTNPLANDPNFGTVYNAIADKRSWIAMKNFFEEIF